MSIILNIIPLLYRSRNLTLHPHAGLRGIVGRSTGFFGRYAVAISFLLGFFVFFNIIDILSTSVALSRGLSEGNGLLVAAATISGLNLVAVMALLKVIFIGGTIGLGILGIRSTNMRIKNMAYYVILSFVFVFIYVSVNNLTAILRV